MSIFRFTTTRNEFKESPDVKGEDIQYSEITYGTFTRSFTLPIKVDADKIAATFENGIIEVALPKFMSALPKHIEVGIVILCTGLKIT